MLVTFKSKIIWNNKPQINTGTDQEPSMYSPYLQGLISDIYSCQCQIYSKDTEPLYHSFMSLLYLTIYQGVHITHFKLSALCCQTWQSQKDWKTQTLKLATCCSIFVTKKWRSKGQNNFLVFLH